VAGEYFVDTSGWYPLLTVTHADHARVAAAVRTQAAYRRRSVTTNIVVAETHALMLQREGRRAALVGLRTMDESARVLVHSTPALEATARREWLERYVDQDFSLADAVSFAVMRERRIEDVLTLDHHFAAAGFRVAPSRA
jgi:predicted nucleic acid-binding protein